MKGNSIRQGKIKRYVEAPGIIVVLDVPVIFAPETPDEPLLPARSLKLLDEAQRRAEKGDCAWLRRHGRIYTAMPA
jgi:hypothetical protein